MEGKLSSLCSCLLSQDLKWEMVSGPQSLHLVAESIISGFHSLGELHKHAYKHLKNKDSVSVTYYNMFICKLFAFESLLSLPCII